MGVCSAALFLDLLSGAEMKRRKNESEKMILFNPVMILDKKFKPMIRELEIFNQPATPVQRLILVID